MTKYHARRSVVDGLSFDSQAEAMRYCQLKLMQEAGAIQGLTTHPRYLLQDKFSYRGKVERAIFYEADFAYTENGASVIEDTKGVKTEAYKIKRKLFLKAYPEIDFREIEC